MLWLEDNVITYVKCTYIKSTNQCNTEFNKFLFIYI